MLLVVAWVVCQGRFVDEYPSVSGMVHIDSDVWSVHDGWSCRAVTWSVHRLLAWQTLLGR